MKKYLTILSVLLFNGCEPTRQNEKNMQVIEKIEFNTAPQNAVFYVATEYVGAGGTMIIIDNKTQRPLEYNGSVIYLDQSLSDQIASKLPSCVDGTPEIAVFATIQLREENGTKATLEQTQTRYYEAKTIKVENILIKADACDPNKLFDKKQ